MIKSLCVIIDGAAPSAAPGHQPLRTTTRIGGDIRIGVERLKQEHERDVVVHGSAQLAQTLLEHDLVDELRLTVFPVVLGNGRRLFGETSDKKTLRLVDSQVVGDGVVILTYAPAPPRSGSV